MTYAKGGIVARGGGPHDDQVQRQAYVMGGRITTEPEGDSIRVTISGGRLAQRVDNHHARITCGNCGESLDIERNDAEPLSDSDITEALTHMRHGCTDGQDVAPGLSKGWGVGASGPQQHTAGEAAQGPGGFRNRAGAADA